MNLEGEDDNIKAPFGRHAFTLNELLSMIEMIREKELIWNKNHPEYSHGLSRAFAFEQISNELNIPVKDLRWKWQILRKEYFKKRSMDMKKCTWKWCVPLSFLENTLTSSSAPKTNKSVTSNERRSTGSSLLASSQPRNLFSFSNSENNSDNSIDEQELLPDVNSMLIGPNIDIGDLDDDETEPKFLCETIYSPSKETNDEVDTDPDVPIYDEDEVQNISQTITNVDHNEYSKSMINGGSYSNKKRCHQLENQSHQVIYYNNKRKESNCINSGGSILQLNNPNHQQQSYNNQNYESSFINETNSIVNLLKTQNQILLNKFDKDDLIIKRLITQMSDIQRIQEREENLLLRQDSFYAYIIAKLPLLQDVPRSTIWINEFQSAIDRAFQDIFEKYQSQTKQRNC